MISNYEGDLSERAMEIVTKLDEEKDSLLNESFRSNDEKALRRKFKLETNEKNNSRDNQKKDPRFPLIANGLGSFYNVSSEVVTNRFGEKEAHHVTCTCSTFQRRGTCDESKMIRLICHNYQPPLSCSPSLFKGWNNVRDRFCSMLHDATETRKATYTNHQERNQSLAKISVYAQSSTNKK